MTLFFAGMTVAFGAVVAHQWLKAVKRVAPPTKHARREHTRMVERDPDFWDIAQSDEPGVNYSFMGVAGEAED